MARFQPLSQVGHMPRPVVCTCGGVLQPVRVVTDPIRHVADCSYACRCGLDAEISVDLAGDPSVALGDYIKTGRPPQGAISASLTMPFASGSYVFPWPNGASANVDMGVDLEPPEPAAPAERGPDLRRFEGSFVGYRAWKLANWQLVGTGGISKDPWTPGVNEAKCAYVRHPAPADDCQCGLYALARFDGETSWWSNADVLGAVEAWADEDERNHDRFFVHGTGFRAQYAKIILLATSDEYPRAKNAAIRALAAEHGADVCKREHLEDMAREHGQLVPDELLEWAKESDLRADTAASASAALQQMAVHLRASSADFQRVLERLSSLATPPLRGTTTVQIAPRPKGVKQTLGYPGPPGHGKHRKHDRVKDARGTVWQCVRGGKPGTWLEET